jgi:hypothetical protein
LTGFAIASGCLLCRLRPPSIRLGAPVATGILLPATIPVGGAVTSIAPSLRTLPAASLGRWSHWPNPSLHSSFASHPSKEPGLGLAEHDEFRIVLGHTQEIEDRFFRLDQ